MTLALGILVSGGGTNLGALLDATRDGRLDADVRVVVSNKSGVFALERAEKAGVATRVVAHREFPTRESFDAELVRVLCEHGVEWIALAGFMRVLTPVFLDAFPGRVVNIHPSLLPAFPGVDAQRQAFDYGAKVSGCTVHFVDHGVDSGPILLQRAVPVLPTDDAESLRARILVEEHVAFVEGLSLIAQGRVKLRTNDSGRTRVVVEPSTNRVS